MILVCVALEDELPYTLPYQYSKIITGVGKINATYTLTHALSKVLGIQCVINYGSAGGFPQLQGKLCEVDYFVQRDMDCTALGCDPYVTIGETQSQIKTYNTTTPLYGCGTGDSFSEPTDDYPLVDMEGYALAKVCKNFNIPFYSYKYVSDSGDPDDWEMNMHAGAEKFLKTLETFDI